MDRLRVLFEKRVFPKITAQQSEVRNQPETVKPLFGFSWLIIFLGICLLGGLWLFVCFQINADYDRTIAEASQETMNLAIAFEEHVKRVVADADKDLRHLKLAYERDGLASSDFAAFAQTAAEDPSRNLVAIYNQHGDTVVSFIQSFRTDNRSDRDYFQIHRDGASQNLAIGMPFAGSVSGQTIIPLTRRINKPDGSFGGVVFIGLRSDYFTSFYQKIDLGQNQLMSLAGMDGLVRVRQVDDKLVTGLDIRGGETWQRIQAGRLNGTYIAGSVSDGLSRINSYRVMPDYPLIVAVGKSSKVAMAGYEHRKRDYLRGASVASLFILAFCCLLINRHEKLQAQKDQLAVANGAAQQEKDRLTSLISSISDEVWFADPQKRFTIANPSALREFCLSTPEIDVEKFLSSLEILLPDGSPRPIEGASSLRALQGEVVRKHHEIVRTPASGELRHREVSATPVRDAAGNIIGAVSIIRDITERILMEYELEKHRSNLQTLVTERTQELEKANIKLVQQAQLLELAHDYIMVSDMDSKIIYWNRGAESGYGWLADEAMGQVTHGLLKTQFPDSVEHLMDSLLTEGHWEGELTHTRKDGKQIIVHSYLTLNRDASGNPLSILGINHDITALKKTDADLARLDRLNTIGEMAASIGHEVRNPLTTVRGYLQHFGRKAIFADYRHQMDMMIEELDRANAIITEFLSLAKNKAVKLSSTDLNQVIKNLVPLLQPDALLRGSNIELELEDIPQVLADEQEIRQCILNLVSNALDATSKSGTVTIGTAAGENRVVLSVRDQGPGIPPEIKDNLGTPFLTTKENGVGLGLAVCYRIAQRHQATIKVETGSEGTAFHFIFDNRKS